MEKSAADEKPSIWGHTPDPEEQWEDVDDDDPGEAGSPVDVPIEVVVPPEHS